MWKGQLSLNHWIFIRVVNFLLESCCFQEAVGLALVMDADEPKLIHYILT